MDNESLAHTKWNCKYHLVFSPKYRKQVIYGKIKADNHQPVCAKQTFKKLNFLIYTTTWNWAKRRHPNKSGRWIKDRYWKTEGTRDWIFTDGKATLIRPSDIPIVRHERLKLDMNPYTDNDYFLKKKEKRRAYKETAAFKSKLTLMKDLEVKSA